MADLDKFRSETRAWLEANCPPEMRRPMTSDEDTFWGGRNAKFSSEPQRVWFERMRDKGWTVPHWPREYGGGGLDGEEAKILRQEMAAIGARQPLTSFGISMLGPALLKYGTDAQKKEHLPKITAGLIRWCQGYSEPNAGSDLASLQTRAESDGDDYIINGQKIWTTGAQFADWMYMLVRTDPDAPKHRGITYLLVDMKSPGVTVRPLTTLAGTQTFNEVFFEDVRVPVQNRVGEENRGWYVGTTTLDFERSSIGSAVGVRKALEGLLKRAKAGDKEISFSQNPKVKSEFVDRWIECEVAKMLSYRVVSMQVAGKIPNYEASMCKMFSSELQQRIANLSMHLYGMHGNVRNGSSMGYMQAVSSTIAGGTTEIQKGIIATRGLGLPRG
jgi:alkylation response protein AidB-like acyl-CoA dehydrogenase